MNGNGTVLDGVPLSRLYEFFSIPIPNSIASVLTITQTRLTKKPDKPFLDSYIPEYAVT